MSLPLVFLISFFIRVTIIYLTQSVNNYDLYSYLQVGELTAKGINIYPKTALLNAPYFPLFIYLEALVYQLRFVISPLIFIKIIINLFDLGNGYLIYLLTNKNTAKTILYLFNPVSLLVFCFHGQFDSLPLFFFLLAILFLTNQKKPIISLIFYSISIALKTWPILFFIPFIKKIKQKQMLLIIPIILFILCLVYAYLFKTEIVNIITAIIKYHSLFNLWGFGRLIYQLFFIKLDQPPIFVQKIFLTLFLIIFLIYSFFVSKKYSLIKSIYYQLIFFYSFTVGFSVQYFSWFVPFLIIVKPKNTYRFLFFISVYLTINYLQWIYKISYLPTIETILSYLLWFYFLHTWISKNKGL
jgi:Gpi18-like mannosyltransferase